MNTDKNIAVLTENKVQTGSGRMMRALLLHNSIGQSLQNIMFSLREIHDEGYFVELGYKTWTDYVQVLPFSKGHIQKLLAVSDRIEGEIVAGNFTDEKIEFFSKIIKDHSLVKISGMAKVIDENGNELDPEDWYLQRLEQDKSDFITENKVLKEANKQLKTEKGNAEKILKQKEDLLSQQSNMLKEVNSVLEYVHGDKEFIKSLMTKKGALESINATIKLVTDIPGKVIVSDELRKDKDVIKSMKILVDLISAIAGNLTNTWDEEFFQDEIGR